MNVYLHTKVCLWYMSEIVCGLVKKWEKKGNKEHYNLYNSFYRLSITLSIQFLLLKMKTEKRKKWVKFHWILLSSSIFCEILLSRFMFVYSHFLSLPFINIWEDQCPSKWLRWMLVSVLSTENSHILQFSLPWVIIVKNSSMTLTTFYPKRLKIAWKKLDSNRKDEE